MSPTMLGKTSAVLMMHWCLNARVGSELNFFVGRFPYVGSRAQQSWRAVQLRRRCFLHAGEVLCSHELRCFLHKVGVCFAKLGVGLAIIIILCRTPEHKVGV
jgi:hypothetical protein